MSVATHPVTAWYAEERCRSHQAFTTRRMAEEIAARHPLTNVSCPKCNEGRRASAFRCTADPRHFHWGHGKPWEGDQTMTFAPSPPVNLESMRPKRGGKPPKLTVIQAREIFAKTQDGVTERDAKRIGEQYGVHFSTVYDIARGRTYGWATTDLRAALAARKQEGDTVQDMGTAPIVIDTSGQDGTPMHLSMPVAAAPALIADLADALELLLDIRDGKPLPKFVTLDADAIRALVEQARA